MTGTASESPILVTGAAGFVGAAAVHELLARGADVHAVVRPGSRPWRLARVAGRVSLHAADLTEPDAVRRVVAAVRPSVVLHLAAHGAYEQQSGSSRILTTNILGTLHLLEAAAESRGRAGRERRELVGIRIQVGADAGGGPPRPQQRVRGREGGPDAPVRAVRTPCPEHGRRDPAAVLGLRALGGADPPDPDRHPTRQGRAPAGDGGAGDRPRFRLRQRRAPGPPRFRPPPPRDGGGDQPRQRGRDDPCARWSPRSRTSSGIDLGSSGGACRPAIGTPRGGLPTDPGPSGSWAGDRSSGSARGWPGWPSGWQ